ncbi:MAG: DinB family protein, partial [Planctomycetota bacterium]
VSIETHWGLEIRVADDSDALPKSSTSWSRTITWSQTLDHVLSRLPNQAEAEWYRSEDSPNKDPNAVHVSSVDPRAIRVTVDDATILLLGDVTAEWLKQADLGTEVDALVIQGNTASQFDKTVRQKLMRQLNPKCILVHSADRELAGPPATSRQANWEQRSHNTVAVSSTAEGRQLIQLGSQPWQMPDDLRKAFEAMEKSCNESQAVFDKLSVKQLNFRPSNGTHTPRWNCEHMMGRQLLFFSQIYHELEPAISVMDLNPKQMPPDYVAAHADWDGAEEARQMQRVSAFCRRFAYLLEDQPLDQKAPGSRWPTLQALLDQMARHYGEHTANTVKKFDLPDWPQR